MELTRAHNQVLIMDLAAISATGTAGQAGNPRRSGGTWQVFQRALDMVCIPRQRTIFPPAGAGAWDGKGEAGSAPQGRLTWFLRGPRLFTNAVNMPMLEISLELGSSLHTGPANHLLPQAPSHKHCWCFVRWQQLWLPQWGVTHEPS